MFSGTFLCEKGKKRENGIPFLKKGTADYCSSCCGKQSVLSMPVDRSERGTGNGVIPAYYWGEHYLIRACRDADIPRKADDTAMAWNWSLCDWNLSVFIIKTDENNKIISVTRTGAGRNGGFECNF